MAIQPHGDCPACGRSIALDLSGRLWAHNPKPHGGGALFRTTRNKIQSTTATICPGSYGKARQDDPSGPHLHPCHVTGMHDPNHHLHNDRVCSLQAMDVAVQFAGSSEALASLPRELHASCYWCGTRADPTVSPGAGAHADWVARMPAKES